MTGAVKAEPADLLSLARLTIPVALAHPMERALIEYRAGLTTSLIQARRNRELIIAICREAYIENRDRRQMAKALDT